MRRPNHSEPMNREAAWFSDWKRVVARRWQQVRDRTDELSQRLRDLEDEVARLHAELHKEV